MPPDVTCQGTNADGEPCRSPVVGEDGFCPAHRPGGREEMRERARKGAEATARKLRGKALSPDDLPPLTSHEAAETWTDRIGRAAATGTLGANAANAALRAVREWREAREGGRVSERLEELMQALGEWRRTGNPEPVLDLVDGGRS